MDIARGQRIKLPGLVASGRRLALEVRLNPGALALDVACFGLDSAKRLADERYLTFFNQPRTPCGGVALIGERRFELDLDRLPGAIDSLVVTLAIEGPGTMSDLGASSIHLQDGGADLATYRFDGSAFGTERAIMLVAVYRKEGAWRLGAVGQGFAGGLDALVEHFGGTVAEPAAPGQDPIADPDPDSEPVPAPDPAGSGEASVLLGQGEAGESGETPAIWRANIRANPHLMILGLPGMGKTTSLINICLQLEAQGVTPIVFSYHEDIDEKLAAELPEPPLLVRYAGLGFNPMEVVGDHPHAWLDNVGMLRDIFAAVFPDLGELQLGRLREAMKQSYLDLGWSAERTGQVPAFATFLGLLRAQGRPDKGLQGLLTRLDELDDYGLFGAESGAPTLLGQHRPALIEIHGTQNENLQRAFATFVLYNLYQGMFRRGPQDRITHAVIFDEAHRAAGLKLLPTMVKECRKYGIAFVVASQEAKDFDRSLFTGVANYLALRLNEADARLMARGFAASDKVGLYADQMKQMPKYQAMYYGEGLAAPLRVALATYPTRVRGAG